MPPIQHTDNLNADAPMFPQAAEGPTKPVAFEIPLGENLFGSLTKENSSSLGSMNRSPATVGRLPSLGLTNDDIKAKLANADARWKVGAQIDRLLGDLENEELVRKDTSRRRRAKPKLSSNARPKTRQGREEDPEVLKQRLLEKETQAEKNRQRELQKLQAKLARMDQHVRRVQERKRFLEMGSSTDDMSLSVSTSSVSLAV
ncbi:uncharacterized protein SPPG_01424 [Spizellomyces punctatus DAOM BR117]|uniref:Uncharacterized protein n=1 Tax=Spizellomyces punctatus (strain DAOM BR117) TaxID=645134 RepID=A0A0L0HSU4_SPIPD|nr:uncharacterized protein SPPG_01424 [Spizellomyces punctatus DAOM BR117]KND03975.1 hypothetical protein SPPG_01424 [Spizellomyces punctatus DAOM BR117]|eukprot:XP_016612014.1 hypothetical protein SPPG_01424 [Spizellomyces punctatus DAOM BR117]